MRRENVKREAEEERKDMKSRPFGTTVVNFLVSILLIGTCATALAAPKVRIGISIPSADHGWTGGVVWWAKKAMSDWEKKDPDVTFFLVTAASPSEQVGQVENLMVKGIQSLVILPHDSAPLTPICAAVKAAGISLVVVDRGLTKPLADIYVSGDNPGLGRVSAEFMAKESGRTDIKFFLGGAGNKDIIKMVMDKDPLVPADVTYPPSMVASAISMAVMALRDQPLDGFYQKKIPSRIVLKSELITPENAKDYYVPASVF